jgi:hypothetical protein
MGDSDKKRNQYYKKKYNISLETYNKIFETQSGSCAICGKPQSHFRRRLAVDHNHKTKKVRGLLCFRCNYFLGIVERNKNILQGVIEYLEKYKED